MRRFTRLTNAFSKKMENHACAVALHSMYYNFVRIHQTLKVSPAMAAGVTDRLWEMVDVVDVLDAFEAKRKRQPKIIFEVDRWRIGEGYYVKVTIPGSEPETITDTFSTEAEAWRWIKNKSIAWLYNRRNATVSQTNPREGKMADAAVVHVGENSPEYVAYRLLH